LFLTGLVAVRETPLSVETTNPATAYATKDRLLINIQIMKNVLA